jgi:hypothetical protein
VSESIEVILARLDGRMEMLNQTIELRVSAIEKDTLQAVTTATAAHTRLDKDLRVVRDDVEDETARLRQTLDELLRWRERVIGIAFGVAVAGGAVGGTVASGLAAILGGGT